MFHFCSNSRNILGLLRFLPVAMLGFSLPLLKSQTVMLTNTGER